MTSKIITIIGAVTTAAAVSLCGGAAASASPTPGRAPTVTLPDRCQAGASAPFCGTQKSAGDDTSATQQLKISVGPGYQSQVIGFTSPVPGSFGNAINDDFKWTHDADHNAMALWLPAGVDSGNYLGDTGGVVQLVTTDAPGPAEKWDAVDQGGGLFTWVNVGTGRTLKVTTNGGPVVTVKTPATPLPSELFAFVTP